MRKREVLSILNKLGLTLEFYRTFVSDMGWRQYEIKVSGAIFEYSFCPPADINEVKKEFIKWCNSFPKSGL